MNGMDLAGLPDWLAGVGALAKEIGKGGGGSTEEPTVCMSLLPVALGVVFVGLQRVCVAVYFGGLEEGRPLRTFKRAFRGSGEESPDSIERGARRKLGAVFEKRSYG